VNLCAISIIKTYVFAESKWKLKKQIEINRVSSLIEPSEMYFSRKTVTLATKGAMNRHSAAMY